MSAHGVTARLVGTYFQPVLRISLARNASVAGGEPALSWVKGLPDRRWDAELLCWWVTGLGADPAILLRRAGVHPDTSAAPVRVADPDDLDAVLAELTPPEIRVDPDRTGGVLIRPRLAGPTLVTTLLVPMAELDDATGRMRADLVDLICPATSDIRPNLKLDQQLADTARHAWQTRVLDVRARRNSQLIRAARIAGLSPSFTRSGVDGVGPDEIAVGADSVVEQLTRATGGVPEWFGLELYEYQRLGTLAALTGRSLIADAPGAGKALPLNAPLPTPTGWTTMGEVKVGDQVLARDGSAATVIDTSPVHMRPVFEVHLSDGQIIEASDDHEWLVSDTAGRCHDDLVDDVAAAHRSSTHAATAARLRQLASEAPVGTLVTVADLCRFARIDLSAVAVLRRAGIQRERCGQRMVYPLDEALMAMARWEDRLSFARRSDPNEMLRPPLQRIVTTAELARTAGGHDDPGWAIEAAAPLDLPVATLPRDPYRQGLLLSGPATADQSFEAPSVDGHAGGIAVLERRATNLAAANTVATRIPPVFLRASAEQRLALLRGVMDGCGATSSHGTCTAVIMHSDAADDVQELIRTLGMVARRRALTDDRHLLTFHTTVSPFGCTAKTQRFLRARKRNRDAMLGGRRLDVVKVVAKGPDLVRCILVDHPEHLFLTGGFVATHNTRQALAVAASVTDWEQRLREPSTRPATQGAPTGRTLIVAPPVVLTHWARETVASHLAAPDPTSKATWWPKVSPVPHSPAWQGPNTHTEPAACVVIQPGRKLPALPERGVVIVADSILASRPFLVDALVTWSPSLIAYDEAHRARTWSSTRSQTMRNLIDRVRSTRAADPSPSGRGEDPKRAGEAPSVVVLPLTGTPMFTGSPAELIPLLAMTGHLDWVFGGRAAFAERFCRRDHFGRWVGRAKTMAELRRLLDVHVWVRRHKADILPWLPEKRWVTDYVDVPMTAIRAAHADIEATISDWLDALSPAEPTADDVEAWCRGQIGLLSPLRRATGLAKVGAAVELIETWLAGASPTLDDDGWRFAEPLVLWAHHQEVIAALADHAHDLLKTKLGAGRPPVGVIDGSTGLNRRTELVDALQDHRLGVLICQITAAGVGLTLTACASPVFVESDWTAQLVSQAEDRHHRPGQTKGVTLTQLCATGTLDEHLFKVRYTKEDTAALVVGDRQGRPTRDERHDIREALTPWQLLADMVADVRTRRTQTRRGRRAA